MAAGGWGQWQVAAEPTWGDPMRGRGSAGILQVPTHRGVEALDHVTQGVTQTPHFLCPNSALFSICRVSVGHRRVLPAVQLLGEGVGSVLECRAGRDFQ